MRQRSGIPGASRAVRAAGLLEHVPHDLSMHERDPDPDRASEVVLLVHEGGEQQSMPPALEEHFGRQSERGAGGEERDVRS